MRRMLLVSKLGDNDMNLPQEKEDPVKLHKEANALYDTGKYEEAKQTFSKAAELYHKVQNFFDSTTMLYKAGECEYQLKEFEKAIEYFTKSAELSFKKGFIRFGVSALEYSRDCYKSLEKESRVKELEEEIKTLKKQLEASF